MGKFYRLFRCLLPPLLLLSAFSAKAGVQVFEPPYCSEIPITKNENLVGLAMPYEDPAIATRLYELGLLYDNFTFCQIHWQEVLPEYAPWSKLPYLAGAYAWAVFVVALIVAILLFQLSPSRWKRYITFLGLLAIFATSWILGAAGLGVLNHFDWPQRHWVKNLVSIDADGAAQNWFQVANARDLDRILVDHEFINPFSVHKAPVTVPSEESKTDVSFLATGKTRLEDGRLMVEVQVASSAQSHQESNNQTIEVGVDVSVKWVDIDKLQWPDLATNIKKPDGKTFYANQTLNIREGPGVHFPLLRKPLQRGDQVTVIEQGEDNWWKVKVNSTDEIGWVSSLWLRTRLAEMPVLKPVASAKPQIPLEIAQTLGQQRTALVIGNSDYVSSPLKNPVNDARSMAETLTQLGFDVSVQLNATQQQMEKAIDQFGRKLINGSHVALFYYAGHGVQVDGENYLIPTGAVINRQSDVRYKAVNIGQVLGAMGDAADNLNIVILDACRDNPLPRSFRSTSRGLAKVGGPKGTIIGFATSPGSVAADGEGDNGIYTKHLIQNMQQSGLTIEQVFKKVLQGVNQETNGKQIPWTESSFTGDFSFRPE